MQGSIGFFLGLGGCFGGEFEFEFGRLGIFIPIFIRSSLGIFKGDEDGFGTIGRLGLGMGDLMGDLAVRASMEKGGLGTVKLLTAALEETAAAMEAILQVSFIYDVCLGVEPS